MSKLRTSQDDEDRFPHPHSPLLPLLSAPLLSPFKDVLSNMFLDECTGCANTARLLVCCRMVCVSGKLMAVFQPVHPSLDTKTIETARRLGLPLSSFPPLLSLVLSFLVLLQCPQLLRILLESEEGKKKLDERWNGMKPKL
eukprot:756054-Hanusia_phi.AAC.1